MREINIDARYFDRWNWDDREVDKVTNKSKSTTIKRIVIIGTGTTLLLSIDCEVNDHLPRLDCQN